MTTVPPSVVIVRTLHSAVVGVLVEVGDVVGLDVLEPDVLPVVPGTVEVVVTEVLDVVVTEELDVAPVLVVDVAGMTSTGRALTCESAKLTICQVTAVVISIAAAQATASFQVSTKSLSQPRCFHPSNRSQGFLKPYLRDAGRR